MNHLLLPLFLVVASFSHSQLILGGSPTAQVIAQSLAGSGVTISNISYYGPPDAISYFSSNTNNMSITNGLLLTTGSKYHATGPNNKPDAGIDQNYPGDTYPIFSSLFPSGFNHDCAKLEFDIVPSGSTLRFRYQFGSEEYPEYANTIFSDAVVILISGIGIPGGTWNMARINNGVDYYVPVITNNINNGNSGSISNPSPAVNPGFFIENGNGTNAPYNSSSDYLQYDGLTIPLTAEISVHYNETYRIMIWIADGADAIFDSGVFLEEGGITASTGENHLDNFVNVIYNPMDQMATIKITEHPGDLACSVVDLSGKTIEKSNITETTTIDLSDYAPGMYLIRVEGSNGEITKKVVR
jgi:hypothetical protein